MKNVASMPAKSGKRHKNPGLTNCATLSAAFYKWLRGRSRVTHVNRSRSSAELARLQGKRACFLEYFDPEIPVEPCTGCTTITLARQETARPQAPPPGGVGETRAARSRTGGGDHQDRHIGDSTLSRAGPYRRPVRECQRHRWRRLFENPVHSVRKYQRHGQQRSGGIGVAPASQPR